MNMVGKSILVVDLDTDISSVLFNILSQEGYFVTSASSGSEALGHLQHYPDLIIIDLQLPDMNGLDFLRVIKQQPELSNVPVFILSNKETEIDEIISLEIGADDYITKPVQIPRLKARIRALFRRQDQQQTMQDKENDMITIDDLSILIQQFTVICGKDSITFSKKEFEILVQLVKNYGRVVTRQVLFHTIWGRHNTSDNRTIDVHIGRIRRKLKGYAHYIETVPGVGYRFQGKQAVE